MNLLIIGGTIFVGRHLVESALARGHCVTLFNRGKQNGELFDEVEKLRGDRDGNLEALAGRNWDCVIDTCGYVPRVVRQSLDALSNSCDHYTFISTCSVYKDKSKSGIVEQGSLDELVDITTEEITGETYGGLKALCEKEVEKSFAERNLIIRPGLIVGPHDATDRFTYWPVRVSHNDKVLAPGNPERQIQIIDVRDLAEWTIRLVEQKQTGVFNACGPDYKLTMKKLLDECKRVTNSDCEFVWRTDQFLLDNEIEPWSDLPLWLPNKHEAKGILEVENQKAVASGLTFRPLSLTISDTLNWYRSERGEAEFRAGISSKREQGLVKL